MDLVGRYDVKMNGKQYDTVCLMGIFENGVLTESYIDKIVCILDSLYGRGCSRFILEGFYSKLEDFSINGL